VDSKIRIGLGFCNERFRPYRRFKTPGRAWANIRFRALAGDRDALEDAKYLIDTLRAPYDPNVMHAEDYDYYISRGYHGIKLKEFLELAEWQLIRPYVNNMLASYRTYDINGRRRTISVRV
jgi:hypothetical protein